MLASAKVLILAVLNLNMETWLNPINPNQKNKIVFSTKYGNPPACMITVKLLSVSYDFTLTRTAKKKRMASVMKKVHNLNY